MATNYLKTVVIGGGIVFTAVGPAVALADDADPNALPTKPPVVAMQVSASATADYTMMNTTLGGNFDARPAERSQIKISLAFDLE